MKKLLFVLLILLVAFVPSFAYAYDGDNPYEYNLDGFDGKAKAIFTFAAGHNYQLNMVDILTLTPEQVEEAFGYPAADFEVALEQMKEQVKPYGTLLHLFAITIDEPGNFSYSSELLLKLNLTDSMRQFDALKFLYLDETNGFKVMEQKVGTINGTTVDFDLDHLSAYALVGYNNEEEIPPTWATGEAHKNDSMIMGIVVGSVALLGVLLFLRKREN